jgi:hypothetical protein
VSAKGKAGRAVNLALGMITNYPQSIYSFLLILFSLDSDAAWELSPAFLFGTLCQASSMRKDADAGDKQDSIGCPILTYC